MNDDSDQWYTVEEAAHVLGRSTRQVRRYADDGSITTRKAKGGRVLYYRADVHVLLSELSASEQSSQPKPAPPPRAEVVQQQRQSELLAYLRERDAELRDTQRMLYEAMQEIGRLRAESGQRLLPTEERHLRERMAEVERERDDLRHQLDELQRQGRPWWKQLFGG